MTSDTAPITNQQTPETTSDTTTGDAEHGTPGTTPGGDLPRSCHASVRSLQRYTPAPKKMDAAVGSGSSSAATDTPSLPSLRRPSSSVGAVRTWRIV